MRLVGLIHSTRLVIEPVHRVMARQCPDIDFFHLMDEGILRKLAESGKITPEITQWLADMVLSAKRAGADMVVVSCSSLSPCVNAVQKQVGIPVIQIDAPMMEHAVTHAERIGLVMTNPTTEAPSKLLFREVSDRLGRDATLVPRLCPQAFVKLNQGDVQGHDLEVIKTVEDLLSEVDVVLLAQISIARIKDRLDGAIKARVFSSLDFIIPEIRKVLALQREG
jgi:glutamate racemase